MKSLIELLKEIFGSNVMSKTIGTRTNVIKLPSNKSNPRINEFDVMRASDNPELLNKIKKIIEDEIPFIPQMNDSERLIYEGNVKRLKDTLVTNGQIKPPIDSIINADVIGMETKEPITGGGLKFLIEKSGQVNPPGSLMGDIETRVNRLKAMAEKKGMNLGEVLKETGEAQVKYAASDDIGLLRSVARQIMFNDIKSGKLKVTKEIKDIVSGASNIDVIEPFRNIYGENALEQLDSLIPDFKKTATEIDAEKLARSKFTFEPKKTNLPETTTIEEAKKAEQEFAINKPEEPEKKAKGGSAGLDYLMGF